MMLSGARTGQHVAGGGCEGRPVGANGCGLGAVHSICVDVCKADSKTFVLHNLKLFCC